MRRRPRLKKTSCCELRVVTSRDDSVPWGMGDAAPPRISEMDQDGHPQVKVETEEIREFKWVNVIQGATFKPRLQNKHQLAV